MAEQKVIVFGVDGLIPDLVYKFKKEGHLPHISRMMEEGASSELIPFIPTWGDVNWVSFLTGQSPGASWKGQAVPKSNQGNLLGLTDNAGKKCALVHFPESVSMEGTNHFEFAPFYSGNEHASFELAAPKVFTTDLTKWKGKQLKESLGWPPSASLAHHEKNNRALIGKRNKKYYFTLQLNTGEELESVIEFIDNENIRVIIQEKAIVELTLNHWSNWVEIGLGNGEWGVLRFKLAHYNYEKEEIDIIQSQFTSVKGFSNDPALEQYILDKCGPFISKWAVTASVDEMYHETSFEEGEYQANWLAEAALSLVKDKGLDLFATVFRLNDETHHTSLGQCDPSSPFYSASQAKTYEDNIRKSYEVLDKVIGKLMKEKDENTTLILASDHGNVPNHYFCDIYLRLEKFGLCSLDENGIVDVKRSKAFLKEERGGLEVFVNLIEREAFGIVSNEEYEEVQTQIFRALSTWSYATKSGEHNVTAITLKKQDAENIGYWGPDMGDVIFSYAPGFVWGKNNKEIVGEVTKPGANHGPQIPTAKTEFSSNKGIFIVEGKNFRRNYINEDGLEGPYFMKDAGKTILNVLQPDTGTALSDGRLMGSLMLSSTTNKVKDKE